MSGKQASPRQQTENTLESSFKTLIAAAGGIYVVGFVVVNSHLARFGIIDYGLVEARYLAAGLNYAVFHVGIAFITTFAFEAIPGRRRWLFTPLYLWVIIGAYTYFVGKRLTEALVTGVNALVMGLLAYQFSRLWNKGSNHGFEAIASYLRVPQQSVSALFTVLFFFLIAFSTLTWGRSVWPLLNQTFGGGRPGSVVVALQQDNLSVLDYQVIPLQDKQVSQQLPLLFEDSDGYVILVSLEGNNIAVRLPRSAVSAVMYAPLKAGGQTMSLPAVVRAPSPSASPRSSPGATP
jgi:hypothetical protein